MNSVEYLLFWKPSKSILGKLVFAKNDLSFFISFIRLINHSFLLKCEVKCISYDGNDGFECNYYPAFDFIQMYDDCILEVTDVSSLDF